MAIYTIQMDDTFTSNPKEINEAFLSYNESLYTSQEYNTESIQHFLDKLTLPTLSDDKKERLEGSIKKEEVMKALTSLASGKSLGQDGFPMEFFKAFIPKLTEPMLSMFNYAIETGRFPESLEQALIIVLPKPGKDLKLCSLYRLISILPSDYNIFSKVLALQLEKVLPDLINMDQTGFIQNRSSIDNVRLFFNIIYSSK